MIGWVAADHTFPSGETTTMFPATDIDANLAWLTATFGFDAGEMPIPNRGTYYML